MKAEIGCAVLLCLMGNMAGAAASGNMAGSIESDPIDSLEIGGGAHALMASTPQIGDTVPMNSVLDGTMQSLVTQAQNTLGFNNGETTMLIADVPNAPPSTPPVVMVAQVNSNQQAATQPEHVLGICDVAYSGQAGLSPEVYANFYFKMAGISINPLDFYATAKVSIIQQPVHGSLEPDSKGDWGGANYVPNDNYLGQDSFVMQVEGSGYKVKLHYFMYVTDMVGGVTNPNPICKGEQGRTYWKISQDANGTPTLTLTAINYQSPIIDASATITDTATLASTLETSLLSNLSIDPSLVTLNIADLPGGAVGQTVGTNITLDDNAAGNGWFIDTTPADNSEFLPTSNPNEWVAKAGSDAAGKMDMLSVLLHEYGHALGIEHSADSGNYMGTTLTENQWGQTRLIID